VEAKNSKEHGLKTSALQQNSIRTLMYSLDKKAAGITNWFRSATAKGFTTFWSGENLTATNYLNLKLSEARGACPMGPHPLEMSPECWEPPRSNLPSVRVLPCL
jgi:hypothetical protein